MTAPKVTRSERIKPIVIQVVGAAGWPGAGAYEAAKGAMLA
ncbi:hypothetical protein [uncultured Corynebacterium sp.]|nr:hypothetical protein [uncultured Corynebacterium sp.]